MQPESGDRWVACPDCGQHYARSETACPHCGHRPSPMSPEEQNRKAFEKAASDAGADSREQPPPYLEEPPAVMYGGPPPRERSARIGPVPPGQRDQPPVMYGGPGIFRRGCLGMALILLILAAAGVAALASPRKQTGTRKPPSAVSPGAWMSSWLRVGANR